MFAPAARESPPPGHDWSVDGSEVMLEGCGLVAARKVYEAPSSDGGRDVFGGFHQPDRDPATLARRIWRVCPVARKRRYLSSTQSARFILRSSSSVDHFSVSVAVRELGAGSLSLDFSSLSSPFQLPHSLRIFAELLYSRLPGGPASDGVTPLSQTLAVKAAIWPGYPGILRRARSRLPIAGSRSRISKHQISGNIRPGGVRSYLIIGGDGAGAGGRTP